MKRAVLAAFILSFLTVGSLVADHRGRGRERYRDGVFVGSTAGLPPGLAKRGGNLPPGLQRHVDRTGQLPPGLEKKRGGRDIFYRGGFVDIDRDGVDDRSERRTTRRRFDRDDDRRNIFWGDDRANRKHHKKGKNK